MELVEILSVIVIKRDVVNEIFSFLTPNGKDEAEALFKDQAKQMGCPEDRLEDSLEEGYFSTSDGSVCITWSDARNSHERIRLLSTVFVPAPIPGDTHEEAFCGTVIEINKTTGIATVEKLDEDTYEIALDRLNPASHW